MDEFVFIWNLIEQINIEHDFENLISSCLGWRQNNQTTMKLSNWEIWAGKKSSLGSSNRISNVQLLTETTCLDFSNLIRFDQTLRVLVEDLKGVTIIDWVRFSSTEASFRATVNCPGKFNHTTTSNFISKIRVDCHELRVKDFSHFYRIWSSINELVSVEASETAIVGDFSKVSDYHQSTGGEEKKS